MLHEILMKIKKSQLFQSGFQPIGRARKIGRFIGRM